MSFAFYSGILLFIASLAFIFVFVLLFLLAEQFSDYSRKISFQPYAAGESAARIIIVKIISTIIPILLCVGLGYLIYKATKGYFPADSGIQDISIIGIAEISEVIFYRYNVIIFLFVSAVLITSIWFIVILAIGRKSEGENNR